MTEQDRLRAMIRILVSNTILVDQFGSEYVVTGFKDDGRVALLSRQSPPKRSGRGKEVFPNVPMEVRSLDGFTVKATA